MNKAISINPSTWEKIFEIEYISTDELNKKIVTAQNTYKYWKNTTFEERKILFENLVKIMSEKKEYLAKLNTLEMWMLYKDALWDVSKSMTNISYFAQNSEKLLKDEVLEEWWIKVKIIYEPMWIVYCIAPWNYPYNQIFRSTIPNIMAWNVVLAKHASNVVQVSIEIEKLFIEAWFPEWVFTNLIIPSSYSEEIIKNTLVVWVTITWWDKAWRSIWALAWKYLKPSVLELGWNDSFVWLRYSDLDKLTDFAINARLANCWQKCNSSKRFIILEEIYNEFIEKLTQKVKSLKIWDPFDDITKVWPIAKEDSLNEIDFLVKESIKLWAILITWWNIVNWKWFFYEPTILSWVSKWIPVYDEEVFWPVISIIKAKNIDEIINIANDSKYWLGASIFGDDINEVEFVASKIEVWNIWVNKVVTSYSFLPYWWIKDSWYGKELGEKWIKTFCNQKVIVY